MKVSNAYFKHPVSGEMIKPGEIYEQFNKSASIMLNPKKPDEDGGKSIGDKFTLPPGIGVELSDLTYKELKDVAKRYAITIPKKKSKAAIIDAILEVTEVME